MIYANSEHWEAGRKELREKTLRIFRRTTKRNDCPMPQDRTTCLSCEKTVRTDQRFHLGPLSNDPWSRQWPRYFMLHPRCVPKGYSMVEHEVSGCDGRAQMRAGADQVKVRDLMP